MLTRIRKHWLRVAIVLLACLAPQPATFGSTLANGNAGKPLVLTVDEAFPAPNLTNRCGFAVTAHVFGAFTIKVLPNGVELNRIRYRHVFSGPGGSVAFNHVENVKLATSVSSDGTRLDTITATGTLLYHSVVPGYGSLANNSGRETLRITWIYDDVLGEYVESDFQVVSDIGPNDELTDVEYAAICAELT